MKKDTAPMNIILSVILLILLQPSVVLAGDVFTGFQSDMYKQYFGYLGARTHLSEQVFIQGLTGGFGYGEHDKGGQTLHTDVQFMNLGIGLEKKIQSYAFAAMIGASGRRVDSNNSDHNRAGAFVQLEAGHWGERISVQGMLNYVTMDNFFWGRIRSMYRTGEYISAGMDVVAMGNAGYYAVQTGPVVGVPVGPVNVNLKGGYQRDSTFRDGAYSGIELGLHF